MFNQSKVPFPRGLVWEVTSRCNLHCAHCYNVWTLPGKETLFPELNAKDRLCILDAIKKSRSAKNLRVLTLTGGEPLILNDLLHLLAKAKQVLPKCQINLSTNGLLLTSLLALELKRAGAATVQLTLLSSSPQLHDQMVGTSGAFECGSLLSHHSPLSTCFYF